MIGQQLREARGRKRWKQHELAAALGVTVRTLGAWERGEVQIPITAEALIRDMLPVVDAAPVDEGSVTLASATDAQLMTALANRLAARNAAAQRDEADATQPPVPVGELAWMQQIEAEVADGSERPPSATPRGTRSRVTGE